jgi:hypothetical protein
VSAPTEQQFAVLVLATSEGYVRPASATHQRRTRNRRLGVTVKACVAAGWMAPISGGRFRLTEAGEALVPSRPRPHRRDLDGPDDEAQF